VSAISELLAATGSDSYRAVNARREQWANINPQALHDQIVQALTAHGVRPLRVEMIADAHVDALRGIRSAYLDLCASLAILENNLDEVRAKLRAP
jgi:hypothetical protein